MNSCFHGSNLKQASALIGLLVSILDKSGAGPKTAQLESLSAACLLLRLTSIGECSERHSNILWNLVLDMDKQYFVSEKFLANATDSGIAIFVIFQLKFHYILCSVYYYYYFILGLQNVVRLSERVLLDHVDRINGKGQPIYKAIIYCLTVSNNSVREFSRNVVKRLVSVLGGTKLALSLIKEFPSFLDAGIKKKKFYPCENKGIK